MPESGVNAYKADLRAIEFTLYEHLKVQQLFQYDRFSHLTREDCDAVLKQVHRFATEVSGPLNAIGDRTSCRLENGVVRTPPGFKEAWRKLFELGLIAFAMPQEAGGFGAPSAHEVILQEFLSGANTAFNTYPGLTHGAADVIHHFALPEDKARFLPHMISGRFSGTMCLSEPHAGSDVGATPRPRPCRASRGARSGGGGGVPGVRDLAVTSTSPGCRSQRGLTAATKSAPPPP